MSPYIPPPPTVPGIPVETTFNYLLTVIILLLITIGFILWLKGRNKDDYEVLGD